MKAKCAAEAEVERILLSNYAKYYRLAYSYAGNEQDAMDIVQESAYKAIRECRKIKELSYTGTWVYRLVINTALDHVRKRGRETSLPENLVQEYHDTYQDIDVMEALKKLEGQERAIIILKYFEGLKLEEVARALDENINTVKSRMYRALKKLRIDLEAQEGEAVMKRRT